LLSALTIKLAALVMLIAALDVLPQLVIDSDSRIDVAIPPGVLAQKHPAHFGYFGQRIDFE
jgi:hypothetical protein